MNKYLQRIYLNIFFILLYKKLFFLFCYNKTIYVPFECMNNKSTLSKKYLFLKPASGSENYYKFIASIGIGTRIGIGILMKYRNSYRNRYKIWYRPITNMHNTA